MSRMDSPKKFVRIVGSIIRRTDKAIQLDVDGKAYWFPFSKIRKIFDCKDGSQDDYIECEDWLLKDKDITEDNYQPC